MKGILNTLFCYFVIFVLQSFTNQYCTTIQLIISHQTQAIQLVPRQITDKSWRKKKHCNYDRKNKCTSNNGSEFDIYSPSNLWIPMEGYNTYNFFYILFVLQSFTNQCCTTIQPIISHQAIQLVLCQIWLNLKKQTNKKTL